MPRDLSEFFATNGVHVSADSGGTSDDADRRIQHLAIKDRVLYSWTKIGLRVAAGLKYSFNDRRSTERKCTFENEVKLNLTTKPEGDVEWLELNRSGSCLAICCSRRIYVVFLPRALWLLRSLNELESDYLCRCVAIDTKTRKDMKCLRAKWHPGSQKDRHLVTLWSDDAIRVYNVGTGSESSVHISLRNVAEDGEGGCSLAESAVAFDFGSPFVEAEGNPETELWPIFVLCANGDMYSVISDVKANRYFDISGPIRISPSIESSYGAGSCDVAFLHGKLPSLVIATTYGIFYHALIFRDEARDTPGSPSFRLHILESAEVEFALSTVDLTSTEIKEDNEASNVLLLIDPLIPRRYYAVHRAGLHRVELPWMYELDDGDVPDLTDAVSNVQYMLCTTPRRAANKSDGCPIGLALLHSFSSESVAIVLASDSSVHYLPASYDAVPSITAISKSDIAGSKRAANRDYFIDTIKRMLQKGATLPLMRGQSEKQISEQEGAELLHRCIEVLQKEYVQRLLSAHTACQTRASELRETYAQQNRDLVRVKQAFAQLKDRLGASKKRKEQLEREQNRLSDRLQKVTDRICAEETTELSTQEENMLEELNAIKNDVAGVLDEFSELKERINSLTVGRRETGDGFGTPQPSQEISVKRRLGDQQRQIESLLRTVKILQKEIQ